MHGVSEKFETVENVVICPDCKSNDVRMIKSIRSADSNWPNKQDQYNVKIKEGCTGSYIDSALFQCKNCKCVFCDYQNIQYVAPPGPPIIW